jgi:hypothetical protein
MRDFTLRIHRKLLTELLESGYQFLTFTEYFKDSQKGKRYIILRHDVDKKPLCSLRMAEAESELGINGTYFFRVIRNQIPRKVIERIAKMGHEIGYHYDDMNAASGNAERALDMFKKNLAQLREVAPVTAACMHGSPMSRYDNRDLWQNFEYRDLGIVSEPYFDIDFNKVLYLTDTGRRWDGEKVSIRDKVRSNGSGAMGKRENRRRKTEARKQHIKSNKDSFRDVPAIRLHSTGDIISAIKKSVLPEKIMLTVHPQRWTDDYLLWIKEFFWQRIKNLIKWLIIRGMGKKLKRLNGQ